MGSMVRAHLCPDKQVRVKIMTPFRKLQHISSGQCFHASAEEVESFPYISKLQRVAISNLVPELGFVAHGDHRF